MRDWFQDIFRGRPWWMNAVMVFSAWMTFIYMPWDIFIKPAASDQEVWFGIMFTGGWAKLMAFPHWFVYGAAVYGFRRRRPWMAWAATLYTAQVAIGMFIWPIFQYGSLTGFVMGFIAAIPFVILTMAFWNTREHFSAAGLSLSERYGGWALVTGASAGIGEGFARALARQGIDCALVARRQEKLEALAGELESQHGIQTRIVVADLAKEEGVAEVASAVADLDIGLLINNAGLGGAGRFDKLDPARIREMVNLNCMAPAMLTHALLPALKSRGRGAIIMTGSVAGRQPLPLHGIYGATKAFDLMLGEALWVELRDEGIDVLVLEPGSTLTEFQAVANEIAHEGQSVGEVVDTALLALGQQPSVISGWMNWLRANAAGRIGSRPLVAYVAREVMEVQTPDDMR
ncbi:MAG: SDR family NAD(P)-dependent oxidoreductase [Myxococcota bacterium]|nr:SDR family NAD(P)-dependent oxidoreductase [Myxococcota bacterium]